MKKLIAVCGSVNKNEPYFEYWKERIMNSGFKVIIPQDVPFYKEYATLREDGLLHLTPEQKTANRLFYYKTIDKCYAIVVVNDIDYVGCETSMEIGYAYAKNKLIFITNLDTKIDCLLSLLQEERAYNIDKLFSTFFVRF